MDFLHGTFQSLFPGKGEAEQHGVGERRSQRLGVSIKLGMVGFTVDQGGPTRTEAVSSS